MSNATVLDYAAYLEEAAAQARLSPCLRGHGGAVVVAPDGEVIGRGFNGPPDGDPSQAKCDTDYRVSRKPKSDRTCCVHAEWRAILDATRSAPGRLRGGTICYASVDEEGQARPSGEPYCTVCSRLALEVGLATFVLLGPDGPRQFPTSDYNDLSYDFHASGQ